MRQGPRPGWFRSSMWSNALVIFLAGPMIALLFYGIAWVVDRPHPTDVVSDLVRFVTLGLVVGTCSSLCYLAYSGVTRLRREWFRFRLRTLFVLLTAVCIAVAWIAASLNWIWQRHEFLTA